jgi:hypothetical protein
MGFMEGGVAWAMQLFASLVSYWEKRNPVAIRNYDPAAVDMSMLERLFHEYGSDIPNATRLDLKQALGIGMSGEDDFVDEWASVAIRERSDVVHRFVDSFYFGCEADDPMVPFAFDKRLQPFGVCLKTLFSSDISHWDVPDMRGILGEAHEAVAEERMDEEQFRDFVYGNALGFYTSGNPGFFDGTVIENQARSGRSGD